MFVPPQLFECVAFIGIVKGQTIDYRGTGFFISMANYNPRPIQFGYLVTAKHVAEQVRGIDFYVRLNKRDGGEHLVHGADLEWHYHPTDPEADVALAPFLPRASEVSFKAAGEDLLVTTWEIKPGDDVVMTGLFTRYPGTVRNEPVVRFGTIAMLPRHRIPMQETVCQPDGSKTLRSFTRHAYLIEARSIGGLSGSPVFVYESRDFRQGDFRVPAYGRMALLGMVHGHWDVPPDIVPDDAAADGKNDGNKLNMGIALVVPTQQIIETRDQPVLARRREEAIALEAKRAAEASPSVPDA